MADLKTRASSILAHLNGDHADSLRSIVARSEELPYLPSRARATAIDADGFDVEYTLQHSLASKAEKRRARVAFKQPLKQSGEARAAFVGLSNESAGLWVRSEIETLWKAAARSAVEVPWGASL
jgi:putative heme iron utilization protein